jgi:hypothetical protein
VEQATKESVGWEEEGGEDEDEERTEEGGVGWSEERVRRKTEVERRV